MEACKKTFHIHTLAGMVCTSVLGVNDCYWYISFALWMRGNGLASLRHDLYIRMLPSVAPHHPLDGLVLGRFGKTTHRIEMTQCGNYLHP